MLSLIKRYFFPAGIVAYAAVLVIFHAAGLFPRPGAHDVSRLIGSPSLEFEGRVLDVPMTRWGRTRFLMEGRGRQGCGRVVVTLLFPCADLLPGETVWIRGWIHPLKKPLAPNDFDEAAYWAGFRTFSAMQVWSEESFLRLKPPPFFLKCAGRFHQRFRAFWFKELAPEEAALMSAITLGNHGVLPPEIKKECIRAGLYHILVVSGQKIALIVFAGFALLRAAGVPRRWMFWAGAPLLLFYTQAVGAEPPVVRATMMALVSLGILAMGRDSPSYYGLFWAAFWILLREPEALFGASFQLSFTATAGLLFFMPKAQRLLKNDSPLLRWIKEAGLLTAIAYVAAGPLLAYYFRQISVIGLIANWTIFPLSGALMIIGLFCGVWGAFFPGKIADVACRLLGKLLHALLQAIHLLGHSSWAAIALPPPPLICLAAYYAALICVVCKVNGIRR